MSVHKMITPNEFDKNELAYNSIAMEFSILIRQIRLLNEISIESSWKIIFEQIKKDEDKLDI